MTNNTIANYFSRELENQTRPVSSPSEAEKLLLGCAYQEFLKRILNEAKVYAERDGSNQILPSHLESAQKAIMQRI